MKCQLACSDRSTVNWIAVMRFKRLLVFRDGVYTHIHKRQDLLIKI